MLQPSTPHKHAGDLGCGSSNMRATSVNYRFLCDESGSSPESSPFLQPQYRRSFVAGVWPEASTPMRDASGVPANQAEEAISTHFAQSTPQDRRIIAETSLNAFGSSIGTPIKDYGHIKCILPKENHTPTVESGTKNVPSETVIVQIDDTSDDQVPAAFSPERRSLEKGRSTGSCRKQNVSKLKEITFMDGDKSLRDLSPYLRLLLEVSCAINKTRRPSCVKSRWAPDRTLREHEGKIARFTISNTETVLKAARFSYGLEDQFIVVSPPDSNSSFNNGKAAIIVTPNKIKDVVKEPSGRTRTPYHVWSPFSSWQTPRVDRIIDPRPNTIGMSISNVNLTKTKRQRSHSVASSKSDEPLSKQRYRQLDHAYVPSSSPTTSDTSSLPYSTPNTKPDPVHQHYEDPVPHTTASAHLVPPSGRFVAEQTYTQSVCNILFIIKKHEHDDEPRRKRFSECKTSRLLSSQASVRGMSPNTVSVFSMHVDGLEPWYIMRNDEDDFQKFCRMVQVHSEGRLTEVTVLPVLE